MVRLALVAVLATAVVYPAFTQTEFDVASIKPHPPDPAGGFQSSMRTLPTGQMVLTNVSVRTLIGRAYPSRGSLQIVGLPSWTEGVYYDVNVKPNRPVSRDDQQEMWRALLADRLKLAAHYELREEASFDMVFARADHKLGPKMKPSACPAPTPVVPGTPPAARPAAALGAPPPPPPRTGAEVMASCNGMMSNGRALYAPRINTSALASFLRSSAGRLIVDKTSLTDFFSVEFSYSDPRPAAADAAPTPGDAAEFFTAIQEDLGLKLEPSKTQVEVVVVEHIERPSED
jgi:uncharacterized protein (TIGR03435 family)